ncbi:hypothetical protein HYZ78_01670 [Candidatus Microgenomates bacterium]|nr:hypothetical protein [Candidatus Microgenomates bacterium]
MDLLFKTIVWMLLVWSAYHTIRDILQDILGIHHPLIDVLHLKPRHSLHFLGQYYKFWGFPLEIATLILTVRSLLTNNFGWEGAVAVGLFAVFISFWAWSSF